MMRTKHLAGLVLASLTLAACGGKEDSMGHASGTYKAPKSADLTVVAPATCGGAALDDAAPADPFRHVPAESLRVVQGSNVRALCDVMKDTPRALALVQFTSVTCVPCMEWAHKLNADLVAKGFGDSVLSVLVVTDPIGMLSADDERRLKRDVAPNASWVYDDFQDLWRFFGPGAATAEVPAVTPLVVAIDPSQRGFTTADATQDAVALVAKANATLTLSVEAKTPTP